MTGTSRFGRRARTRRAASVAPPVAVPSPSFRSCQAAAYAVSGSGSARPGARSRNEPTDCAGNARFQLSQPILEGAASRYLERSLAVRADVLRARGRRTENGANHRCRRMREVRRAAAVRQPRAGGVCRSSRRSNCKRTAFGYGARPSGRPATVRGRAPGARAGQRRELPRRLGGERNSEACGWCNGKVSAQVPMRWRAVLVAVAALPVAGWAAGGSGAGTTGSTVHAGGPITNCTAVQTRSALASFVAAFDAGDYQRLNALFAGPSWFRWYSSSAPGERFDPQARRGAIR